MELIVLSVVILTVGYASSDRIYETECPAVTPMPDFDMKRFLGVWYQVQTDTGSNDQIEPETPACEFYDITNSNHPNLFTVNEMIEIYARFEGDTPLQYESISTSYLNVLNRNEAAHMQMQPTFGDNILESNFTIYATDYDSYAIISNCHKGINTESNDVEFTQHTTLWSRTRTLDDTFVEKLYDSIGSIDFDPYDLSAVEKTGCIEGGKRLARVNLDSGEVVPI